MCVRFGGNFPFVQCICECAHIFHCYKCYTASVLYLSIFFCIKCTTHSPRAQKLIILEQWLWISFVRLYDLWCESELCCYDICHMLAAYDVRYMMRYCRCFKLQMRIGERSDGRAYVPTLYIQIYYGRCDIFVYSCTIWCERITIIIAIFVTHTCGRTHSNHYGCCCCPRITSLNSHCLFAIWIRVD